MVVSANVKINKRTQRLDNKFSILIPTWNNLEYLKLCIYSVRKNSFFKHQIIVHINEGKDGSFEWIKEQDDIDFSISDQNIGVCYALNICRTIAASDYIVYLNDDMYVCPGWDKELYNEIEKIGHNYFFLSATTIEPIAQNNCTIVKDYGSDIINFAEEKLLKEFSLLEMNDWSGATWPPNIVHKDMWDLVGGYSVEFSPGMYSDPDFSMKLWKAGIRIFKGVAKSRVYHFGSVSVKRVKQNRGYYTFISKWAITQNIFSKYYLQRGAPYGKPLSDPLLTTGQKLNNIFKQLKSVFYRE